MWLDSPGEDEGVEGERTAGGFVLLRSPTQEEVWLQGAGEVCCGRPRSPGIRSAEEESVESSVLPGASVVGGADRPLPATPWHASGHL